MLVGDIGKGGRALVGGDDQIGIIAVVAHHVARRHDLAVLDVVGDVEQRRDEDAVGGHALLLDLLAAAGARQLLGQKPPLAPDGTITAFLTCWALHEAQNFGAEILCAGPTSGCRRARSGAKRRWMPSTRGRIDPDLAERPRLRRRVDCLAVELEGQRRRAAAVGVRLVEAGAHRAVDQLRNWRRMRSSSRLGTAASAPSMRCRTGSSAACRWAVRPRCGSKRRWNSSIRSRARPACRVESVGQVAQAERGAELAQIGGVGAQHRGFAPVGAGVRRSAD